MALVYGKNEAHDRLMKELHETNHGGIDHPSSTNNRGHMGPHRARENHAEGDMVGRRSEPGEHMGKAMRHGGRARHAEGDVVRDKQELRKGGRTCHSEGKSVSMKQEQPGERMKKMSGGATRHLEGDSPMRHGGRARHAEGDKAGMSDDGREHHGFGDFLGAFMNPIGGIRRLVNGESHGGSIPEQKSRGGRAGRRHHSDGDNVETDLDGRQKHYFGESLLENPWSTALSFLKEGEQPKKKGGRA